MGFEFADRIDGYGNQADLGGGFCESEDEIIEFDENPLGDLTVRGRSGGPWSGELLVAAAGGKEEEQGWCGGFHRPSRSSLQRIDDLQFELPAFMSAKNGGKVIDVERKSIDYQDHAATAVGRDASFEFVVEQAAVTR